MDSIGSKGKEKIVEDNHLIMESMEDLDRSSYDNLVDFFDIDMELDYSLLADFLSDDQNSSCFSTTLAEKSGVHVPTSPPSTSSFSLYSSFLSNDIQNEDQHITQTSGLLHDDHFPLTAIIQQAPDNNFSLPLEDEVNNEHQTDMEILDQFDEILNQLDETQTANNHMHGLVENECSLEIKDAQVEKSGIHSEQYLRTFGLPDSYVGEQSQSGVQHIVGEDAMLNGSMQIEDQKSVGDWTNYSKVLHTIFMEWFLFNKEIISFEELNKIEWERLGVLFEKMWADGRLEDIIPFFKKVLAWIEMQWFPSWKQKKQAKGTVFSSFNPIYKQQQQIQLSAPLVLDQHQLSDGISKWDKVAHNMIDHNNLSLPLQSTEDLSSYVPQFLPACTGNGFLDSGFVEETNTDIWTQISRTFLPSSLDDMDTFASILASFNPSAAYNIPFVSSSSPTQSLHMSDTKEADSQNNEHKYVIEDIKQKPIQHLPKQQPQTFPSYQSMEVPKPSIALINEDCSVHSQMTNMVYKYDGIMESSFSSPSPIVANPKLSSRASVSTVHDHYKSYRCSKEVAQASNSKKRSGFLLKKVLRQSDVVHPGRIVLPQKQAMIHMPRLDANNQICMLFKDIRMSCIWNMNYRYIPNSRGGIYYLENAGDFLNAHGLKSGDIISIYACYQNGRESAKYMMHGVKISH